MSPLEHRGLGRRPPGRLAAYGLAGLTSLVALGLSFALDPVVEHSPATLFLGAVMLSAWYGGFGPGLLATVSAAAAITYVFEAPTFQFGLETVSTAIDLLIFLLVAFLISALDAHLLEEHRRAEAARREAEAARALAEEAVRIRDNFLASVAHDLKSPLTVVSGQAELLSRRLAGSQQLDPFRFWLGCFSCTRLVSRRPTDPSGTPRSRASRLRRVNGNRWWPPAPPAHRLRPDHPRPRCRPHLRRAPRRRHGSRAPKHSRRYSRRWLTTTVSALAWWWSPSRVARVSSGMRSGCFPPRACTSSPLRTRCCARWTCRC